jgi:hypothetical protein
MRQECHNYDIYDGDPPFVRCLESIMTPLHDSKDSSSLLFESSPSLIANCDGVLSLSYSCYGVPSFYSTNAS